jgi:mannosyl-3-phosphoglycerate phosphatase
LEQFVAHTGRAGGKAHSARTDQPVVSQKLTVIDTEKKQRFFAMNRMIIFTDLDATLIDHDTYGFEEARETLDLLRRKSIPVIICSSKTRAEIEIYRARMNLEAPFVVENGGAIFVPPATFEFLPTGFIQKGPYYVMELGTPYTLLCQTWQEMKAQAELKMTGFSELNVNEIAELTDLSLEEAQLAATREYSEPFVFDDIPERFQVLESLAAARGLRITRGGRFYHVMGNNDKGKAVDILIKAFSKDSADAKVTSVGVGDSANDIPMLRQVNIPVVIRRKSGTWEKLDGNDAVIYSQNPGPTGWAEVIGHILSP